MPFDTRLLNGIGAVAAVVETGSFARAAEALGLTQPAVSRAVARLETRLGLRLFHRTARAVTLTDEGRRFVQAVTPLLAGLEQATAGAAQARAIVRGRLRVNVDAAFAHFVLAPRIDAFLARHPALDIDLCVRDRMGDLVAEGFDVAIRFGAPEPSSLKARLLLRTPVLTCASPAYLAGHGHPAHPRDLAQGHQCLLIRDPLSGRPYGWEFHRGGKVVGHDAHGRLVVDDTGSLLAACLAGAGLAQLLGLYAADIVHSGQLVQVLPDWAEETFPLYVFHHAGAPVPARVRAFLDYLDEVVG